MSPPPWPASFRAPLSLAVTLGPDDRGGVPRTGVALGQPGVGGLVSSSLGFFCKTNIEPKRTTPGGQTDMWTLR